MVVAVVAISCRTMSVISSTNKKAEATNDEGPMGCEQAGLARKAL